MGRKCTSDEKLIFEKTALQEILKGAMDHQELLVSLCEKYFKQIEQIQPKISGYKSRLDEIEIILSKEGDTA